MSPQTEQNFIVRFEIRASATDPTEAVREALEKVQRGALANVAWSVEAVGTGDRAQSVPAPRVGTDDDSDLDGASTAGEKRPYDVVTYHGEFLG